MSRFSASTRNARVGAAAVLLLILAGSAFAVAVSPPTSLTATAISSSQIRLAWVDTNSNESGYFVERSLSSTSGFTQIASVGINVTSYTSTGLAAGTTYYYRVRASMKNGTYSTYSNVASARTLSSGTVPAAPSNLICSSPSSSQITIAWRDNSTNETGFKVERATASAGPWTYIGATAATGYGDSGLLAGRTYYHRVQAYNSYGNSSYSNTSVCTTQGGTGVPTAPSGLTATAVSSSQINLAWADRSGNESGFKIERSTATAAWAQIATTGANVVTFSSTGLTGSTTYSYRVRATSTAGDSAYSNTASATTTSGGSLTSSKWEKSFGSSADDRGQTVAVDGQGRVAVTGSFYGTTNFGGGSISSALCCGGATSTMDIFIAEYGASGGYLWSRVIGSTSDEAGKGVATDTSGNVLVTGYQGSYSVDYGGGPQYDHGGNDIFIAKYSSAGSWVWSKTLGGSGYDQGNAIAADGSGNVFVTGYIGAGGVDFGGGALVSAGLYDVFLAKYTASGAFQWAKRFGGSGNDAGMAVATDSGGNVYIAGSFEGSANFGGTTLSSSGLRDIFVAKYSATGAHVWSKKFGGSGDDVGYGLAVDSASNVFLTGKFQGSVNFGGSSLASAGGDDIFLVKLSSTGSHVWSKGMGGTSSDASLGVDVDGSGNVVMTGYFTGSVNMGGAVLSGSGINVLVAKYNSAGTYIWAKQFGGFDTQIANSVAAGPNGDAIVTGYYASTVDFGTGVLTSRGSYDAFLTNVGP